MASSNITQLLEAARKGDRSKADELAQAVQVELRILAASYLRRERNGGTLQATELINECYLRLYQAGGGGGEWNNRAHFFGVAARSMRQILVDRARRRGALKRPDAALQLSLDDVMATSEDSAWQVVAVHEALERLEKVDPRLCRMVELRFFAGLTVDETAAVMGVAEITVRRQWSFARAWLHRELS
jgi:RNA polymerase sigma factor (TIGR02999 family)